MPISMLFLALVLFFMSAANMGWFVIPNVFLGIMQLVTAILLVVEGVPTFRSRFIK